ncbi:MAG: hypothetical protein GXC76_09295 [Rhodanobacteraceae bacterium]|jgi:hypothetical protein|nr:hypothetical protein [Rhodanobacteraceae bacterium]
MLDFRLGQVIGLLLRTLPFLVLRLLVYMAITLAYVVLTGTGAGIGWLLGTAGGDAGGGAFWGGLAGFGLTSGVLYWAREYLLYLVKAGHIAVLTQLLDGKAIPDGRGQIDYAGTMVRERFAQSSVLFGIDQLVKGILRVFNRVTLGAASVLPLPGLEPLMKLVNAVINTSLTYVDEVVLAHNIRTQSTNPWAASRDAVVLYAQNYKALLKNAVFLTFIAWGLTLLIFLVVFAPVAALVGLFPGVAGFWTFALAAVTAWGLKAALVDPLAMTALMQAYFKLTEGQVPSADWSARLETISDRFRALKDKAAATRAPADAPLPMPRTGAGT